MGQRMTHIRNLIALMMFTIGLAGCMGDTTLPFAKDKPAATNTAPVANFAQEGEADERSEIIDGLLNRTSFLDPAGAYGQVATSILAASARSSEAELRAAQLRAKAQSTNWLPTLGPNISLTSMGDLVASLVIDQVLFDNGKRKAERDYAAADVEYAAVNLSIDMNTRVHTALSLYNSGLLADEKVKLSQRALTRMREFERIVIGRVEGGVSDQADQRVVQAKIKDMLAAQTTSREAARTARAELAVMTGKRMDDIEGHRNLGTPNRNAGFLSIELAKADANRDVAEATAERAGLLPSLNASASVGSNSGAGLNVGGGGWGFGTADSLRAIDAVRETAGLRVDEADENARRTLSRLEQRLTSYQRQEEQSRGLVADSRKTFELFQQQFEAGHRSVMDVANIYEQLVTREQDHLDAKYEISLIQLELARELGVLANGADI